MNQYEITYNHTKTTRSRSLGYTSKSERRVTYLYAKTEREARYKCKGLHPSGSIDIIEVKMSVKG